MGARTPALCLLLASIWLPRGEPTRGVLGAASGKSRMDREARLRKHLWQQSWTCGREEEEKSEGGLRVPGEGRWKRAGEASDRGKRVLCWAKWKRPTGEPKGIGAQGVVGKKESLIPEGHPEAEKDLRRLQADRRGNEAGVGGDLPSICGTRQEAPAKGGLTPIGNDPLSPVTAPTAPARAQPLSQPALEPR